MFFIIITIITVVPPRDDDGDGCGRSRSRPEHAILLAAAPAFSDSITTGARVGARER